MRRITISTFIAGMAGALVLALLLFSGGHTASAATGVSDPITGQVRQFAIDMVTTGNSPGTGSTGAGCKLSTTPCTITLLGPINNSLANVPLNSTVIVDVIVDETAPLDGFATGYGFDLLYNPAIVSIDTHNSNFIVSGGFEPGVVPDPDFSGDWRDDYTTTGLGSHLGEGILTEVGIHCGAVAGQSALTLANGIMFTHDNTNGDPTAPIVPNELHGATIFCGMAAPPPVALAIHSVTTSPAGVAANTPFTVSDIATVTNTGATGPVPTDVTQTLTIPGDCTLLPPPAASVTTSIMVPASGSNSVTTNWTVRCSNPSFHTFSVTQTDTATDPQFPDTSVGDDTDTSASVTAITADADPAITGATTSSSAPSQCLPQSPPAPSCATAPVVAIGSPQTVTVTKTIANLSGFSNYTVQDTVVWVGATEAPAGPSNENPCTMTSATTCKWSGGPASFSYNLTEFNSTCTVTPVGPAGVLGAGSSSQTTPPLTSPQTLTFQFTATCTNNSFFDSHNPKQIVLLFQDQITNTGLHINDTNPANNTVVPITLAFWNRNPNFNPSFDAIIDSGNVPSDPATVPASHNCFTNLLTSPTQAAPLPGIPCEMYFTTHIPAGNPLGLPVIITPQHTATTKGFTIAEGETIPNATVTAAFGFSIDANFGTGCVVPVGSAYPGTLLVDAALPQGNASGTVMTTVGDPTTAPYPGEGLDSGLAADITNPAVWSTRLNADPGVQAMVFVYHAPIWARYTGNDPIFGTPVNILVFNLGAAGYYTLTVTGDPAGTPTPPGTQCTPFDTQIDYLGSTAAGLVIRTCDDVMAEPTLVFVANFTRADTFESAIRTDTDNACRPPVSSMTKNETLPVAGGEIDGGITHSETVTFTPGFTGNLTLSLIGPAVCNPHWTNPLQLFNNTVGGIQTSVVTIPNVSAAVTATYSFNCPPGDFTLQIVANLTPLPGDTTNQPQQVENHVQIHVVANTCNGVPNNLCQCPNGPLDPEGNFFPLPDPSDTFVSNGCPDTNVSVTMHKEENYNVDVSVDTVKHVDITVSNTEFATPVLVHVLAVSEIGQCEVRLVQSAITGPVSNFYTDEDNPAYITHPSADGTSTAVDTLNSAVEFVINAPVNSHTLIGIDYVVHCFQKSTHSPAFELQVDAIPLPPVIEENLGSCTAGTGGAGQPACIPDPANPNNNVAKNFPTVNAFEQANLSKVCNPLTSSVATVGAGTEFTINSDCIVTNNGPFGPVTFTDLTNLTLPPDCTTANGGGVATGSLANGQSQEVVAGWVVTCTGPSFHTFSVTDHVSLTGPIHVYDPCPNPPPGPVPGPHPACADDNSVTQTVTVAVTTVTDASVSAGNPDCHPNSANVGDTITCTEHDTVVLGLASSASLTGTLTVPSDCTITSPNPVTQAAVNGDNVMTWTLVCTGASDHSITKHAVLTPIFPLHVSETNTANNSGNGATVVVVLAHATLGIPPFLPAPGEFEVAQPPSSHSDTVTGTVTSSGNPVTIGWTVTANGTSTTACDNVIVTGASSGAGSAVASTVTATLPAGPESHECTYQICITATATGVHEVATPVTLCQQYSLQSNVLVAKYCLSVGPAAVNLSDTNGRYMWVICEIGNVTNEAEQVTITTAANLISGALPAGCTRTAALILPGQTTFTLAPHEQKMIVFRVRYECHAPATGVTVTQTVTFTVTHVNDAGTGRDVETILADNTKITTKPVIIQ
jgi:hypothetical protein